MEDFNSAVKFLRLGHVFMFLIYFCMAIGFVIFTLIAGSDLESNFASREDGLIIIGMMIFICLLIFGFAAIYGIAIIKAGSRTNRNWIFQIVLLCIGFSSIITAIFYVPALFKLTNPNVRKYFVNN